VNENVTIDRAFAERAWALGAEVGVDNGIGMGLGDELVLYAYKGGITFPFDEFSGPDELEEALADLGLLGDREAAS